MLAGQVGNAPQARLPKKNSGLSISRLDSFVSQTSQKKSANQAKEAVSRNVNKTADSAKKNLKSQKSTVSAKSTSRGRPAKVEKPEPKTSGLTQKQKDDRKRAS